MLVELVMCILWPSRAQELPGKPCQGTGGKIGRATLTSMAKASLSRLPQVMAAVWCLTMLPLVVGPLGRHFLEGSFGRKFCILTTSAKLMDISVAVKSIQC